MYADVVLGVEPSPFRGGARAQEGGPRRQASTPTSPPTTGSAIVDELQEDRREAHRQAVPAGPARAALGRDRRGVRLVDEPARHHLPPPARHPGELGHRGQRAGDGVRQHGRRLRHRRRLHPRSVHRRERVLRRVPGQRPGRGRGRRHPHAAASHDRRQAGAEVRCAGDGRGDARRSSSSSTRSVDTLEKHYSDMQDIEFTMQHGKLYMLQTRNGKRTGRGRAQDRRRHGARGADRQEGGGGAHRCRRRSTSCCTRRSIPRPSAR